MSNGLIFVTACEADAPLVNRLLLYLRNYDDGHEDVWDCFRVVTSKIDPLEQEDPTSPPLQAFANEWAGSTVADVETFMVESKRRHDGGEKDRRSRLNLTTFLVVDDVGAREGSVVLLHRGYDVDAEPGPCHWLDSFRKVRLPWDEAYTIWCNLDIGNMGFEEFCDQERGGDAQGWWVYQEFPPSEYDLQARVDKREAPVVRKRNAAIKALHELDLA